MIPASSRADGRRAAAFLDRDGTLNVAPPGGGYLEAPDRFEWLPGAREGVARLAALGYVIVVASNQQGVALGLVTRETLAAVEARIQRDLSELGCSVAGFRYCTHLASEGCACRKPRPGLLLGAARELGLDLSRSWMVGDSLTDVAAGRAAGCRTALLGTPGDADVRAADLDDASRRIPAA